MGDGVQLARVPPIRFLLPYRCQVWKNAVCKLALCLGGVPRVGGGGMPPGVRYAHKDGASVRVLAICSACSPSLPAGTKAPPRRRLW